MQAQASVGFSHAAAANSAGAISALTHALQTEAKLLHDLVTPRLLGAIFFAIDYEALQATTARRIPLADILSEDADLIPDLLATADPETARDLANTLLLNQGFEELTKKALLARFIKIFPKIQSLVAADAAG